MDLPAWYLLEVVRFEASTAKTKYFQKHLNYF